MAKLNYIFALASGANFIRIHFTIFAHIPSLIHGRKSSPVLNNLDEISAIVLF